MAPEDLPTALIVDDEPLARRRLRDLVAERPLVRVVGEAVDGGSAVVALDELQPDVAFLDVHMPGATGLEVLQRARHRPAVIFTTAFDRYAVAAFELAAVDYLLKPFAADRFEAAVLRAVRALGHQAPELVDRAGEVSRGAPLSRVFVRERGQIIPIRVDQIERCEARDDYVALYTGGRRHLMLVRLQDLAERLGTARFLRVHRSHLVNLDFVKAFAPHDGHRLAVEMRDGTRIVASRSGSRAVHQLGR